MDRIRYDKKRNLEFWGLSYDQTDESVDWHFIGAYALLDATSLASTAAIAVFMSA